MGAKMEYDMRNDIFDHYQKLSFNFYDNQKVRQLILGFIGSGSLFGVYFCYLG